MLTIGEFIRHKGEWDIDNHLKELTNQFLDTLKERLKEDVSIKEVCQSIQNQMSMLRQGIFQWINTRSEREMSEFASNVKNISWQSEEFAELAKTTALCINLSAAYSEQNWSPSAIQKLVDNPEFENKLNKIKGEHNRQNFIDSIILASFYFETCCIVADLIIDKEISKSKEWISELNDYLQITFVINTALSMEWGLFKLDKEIVQNTPILNRAKILKADISMFGVQNIYHLIA